MLWRPTIPVPVLALAALAVALPARMEAAPELTSQNHPALQRAFTESPQADKDANGALSLAEYEELLKHERPYDPENPNAPLLPVRPDGDLVIHEFEDNNVMQPPKWSPVRHHALKDHPLGWHMGGNWTREGDAFNRDLQSSTNLMKRRVGPYEGKFFLTTIGNTEHAVGSLTSTVFLLEQDYLLVTMSGGGHPGTVCVNLHTKDGIVRSATGRNDDYFEKVALDVREFRGQLARIELRDQHRGLWGHLNVDEILLSARATGARVVNKRPAPLVSTAGLAVTTGGRVQGALKLENGQLTSGGKPVAGHVLLALNAGPPNNEALKGAVRLLNGEIWRGDLGAAEGAGSKRTLALNGPTVGQRKVPFSDLASMDFISGRAGDAREPGTLYRTNGEPIPGKLIWVRAKDIAIRSPLGILPIPRPTVESYVLARPAPPAARTTDEIGLRDGSLLFGPTRFEGSQLVITHEILGELKIDWNAVRSLRRNMVGLTWLDTVEHTVVETVGPALPPPAPRVLPSGDDSHLSALRVMPHTVVSIDLPSGPHTGATLRGELHPVPGARAGVKVALLAGDTVVWNQQVPAGSKPIPLSVNLSNAAKLTLRVEFDGPLSFPCGIDLRDAHIVTLNNLGTEPN